MSKKGLITGVVIGLLVGMALAGFVVFSKLKQHGKFPGGTTVAGVELSYKTPEEALKLSNRCAEAISR